MGLRDLSKKGTDFCTIWLPEGSIVGMVGCLSLTGWKAGFR